MEYRVLGPLEVLDGSGEKRALGGAMQQSVLASLLLRAGQTVALERLVDDLWDEPPETAARTVQAYVSRLRHELPEGAIQSHPGGYRLVLHGAELDLETFEQRAEEGHTALAAGACERAADLLREGLALWRGPALVGLNSETLRREAQRLEEMRMRVLEDRLEADLSCGRHGELVAELTAVVDEHPFRERARAQLMRALYYSGRPGDALALYRDGRRMLVEELGLEPGQTLRELELAILRQDAEIEAPGRERIEAPGWERSTPALPVSVAPVLRVERRPTREVRKTVTILFCDVVDSTGQGESTDPEVVRSRLARFFEQMKMIIERHGGTVEKFIGDAVMAVFGVPRAHEDDALRACRAAIEMQEALPSLGVEGRVGLTTGEVVTGTEERLATGDAVNVAARLEQAAGPGEVLIGEPTLELARNAVEVEAVAALELKGKAEPVDAYRLLRVRDPPIRGHATSFVGRHVEFALLQEAWDRVRREQRCALVTVVGDPGIGKSRLIAEFCDSAGSAPIEGRCLPYGEGITYWPVVEVLKQLDVASADDAVATPIRSLLTGSQASTSAEEIAWAFRKMLEHAAENGPLLVVFDDIQWGEDTFLDLVEHVAILSSGAALMLLCIARPELIERRPTWPVTFRLEPLGDQDIDELIPEQISAVLRGRIARAAAGNPLFVEEMLAMAGERGEAVGVPPTLQALLAARLDLLDPSEREVLERAAVEGEIFHRGSVQALAADDRRLTPRLASLVRKDLIRPDTPQFPDEDGFRFRHILIRDAAYDALPKRTRAELHMRFASWLEQRGSELEQLDEILGYHLERACLYRSELGLPSRDEAAAAKRRLTAAGHRAHRRGDYAAAVRLLERAAALTPVGELDPALETALVDSLFWAGRSGEALSRGDAIAEQAAASGDIPGELWLNIQAGLVRMYVQPEGAAERLAVLIDRALAVFQAAGNDLALATAYHALGGVELMHAKSQAALNAWEKAADHARRAGRPWERYGWRAVFRLHGSTPVSEVLTWLARNEQQAVPDLGFRASHARALGMLGRFDEARARFAEIRAELAERGGALERGTITAIEYVELELLAGDPERAAELGAEGCAVLEELGERNFRSTAVALLSRALYELDRLEEAEACAELAGELGSTDDVATQITWRQVKAKVLARRGEHAEAERLARQAVALVAESDYLNGQGDAQADLAEVLVLVGKRDEAVAALREALDRYERKENLVMAARVRARLTELGASETVARSR